MPLAPEPQGQTTPLVEQEGSDLGDDKKRLEAEARLEAEQSVSLKKQEKLRLEAERPVSLHGGEEL